MNNEFDFTVVKPDDTFDFQCKTCGALYPLSVGPDDKNRDAFEYLIVSKKEHHFNGQNRRVGDWMDENFTQDDREFIRLDYEIHRFFGRNIRNINSRYDKQVMNHIIVYKYLHYDITKDFKPQFVHNMACLKFELERLAILSQS